LLSREVLKGCEDVEGDRKEGVKTLAIRIGIKKATSFSMIFAIFAIIFFVLPIFTNIINLLLFSISMILGLVDVIAAVVLTLRINFEKPNFKRISLMLKLGAFLGLIAFIFASL
jgi:4-hydroxybenzoate polyprenyltransferase